MQDPRGGKVARMLFKGVFLGQVKCVLIFEFVFLFFFLGGGSGLKKKFENKIGWCGKIFLKLFFSSKSHGMARKLKIFFEHSWQKGKR